MKLAALALLIHPLMILAPTGLFVATDWGIKAESNPGAHGFSQVLYQFTSCSANNGSGFEGLGDTWGFNNPDDNPSPPAPESQPLDIATGLVMLFSRFVPIIAPHRLCGEPGGEETDARYRGDVANGFDHLRFCFVGHDSPRGGSALPAGGRAGTGGGALRAATLWRIVTCANHYETRSRNKEQEHV